MCDRNFGLELRYCTLNSRYLSSSIKTPMYDGIWVTGGFDGKIRLETTEMVYSNGTRVSGRLDFFLASKTSLDSTVALLKKKMQIITSASGSAQNFLTHNIVLF